MRLPLALLALAVLARPLAAEPAARLLNGIKGSDDRVVVEAARFPWSAVGRVNNGQGAHCSGVMVGPRLAVTAAHCLWNRRTRKPMPPTSLTFVAAWEKGAYLRAAKVARFHIAPGWRFDLPYGPAVAAADWALLELEEPLGEDVGWIAPGASPAEGDRVVTVGYGQDRPHVATAHVGCRVTGRRAEGLLLHDCDAVKGDSGGPVMVWRDGGPMLAAIHVATLNGDALVAGGAVGADAFRAEALRLGAAAVTRPGRLSRPAGPDLAGALRD